MNLTLILCAYFLDVFRRYTDQIKGQRRKIVDRENETPVVNIIRKSVRDLQDRENSVNNNNNINSNNSNSSNGSNNDSYQFNNNLIEVNSTSDQSLDDKSATSTPTRVVDDNYGIIATYRENDNSTFDSVERPQSIRALATTATAEDLDTVSRPKTANTDRSRSSSIHEIISSRPGSAISSHNDEDEPDYQVVTDYDIDEEPGLETAAKKRTNPDLVQPERSSPALNVNDEVDEGSGVPVKEPDTDEVDNSAFDYTIQYEKEIHLSHGDETENAIVTSGIARDYDSGSLSSDQISQSNETYDKESSILEEEEEVKPVEKRKRLPMLLRRNRVGDIKSIPATTSVHAAPTTKSNDLFASIVLRRFDKPREAYNNCLTQLDSANWETTMNGLQNFVRLIRFHPELVECNIHTLSVALCKHVRNLRSQVSRSACQASGEFFATHSRHLEQEIDDLATTLLNRTADTNKFLRADASKALNAMVDNMPPQKTIQAVVTRGVSHPNAIVRTASAILCNRIIDRLGADKVFSMHRDSRDKLILSGANFMMEGSLETRNHAKLMFRKLAAHPAYARTILEVIPPRTYRNIEKTLKTIK